MHKPAQPTVKSTEPDTYSSGAYSSYENLQSNGSATLGEIQEFLARTRGKSPQEVIGIVARSGLVRSTVLATTLIFAFVVVFTVIPYFIYGGYDDPSSSKEPVAEASAEEDSADESETADDGEVAADTADTGSSGDPALDAMGIGDAKNADPNKNPLDGSPDLDNLLDKID